jgi:hypothetical protein
MNQDNESSGLSNPSNNVAWEGKKWMADGIARKSPDNANSADSGEESKQSVQEQRAAREQQLVIANQQTGMLQPQTLPQPNVTTEQAKKYHADFVAKTAQERNALIDIYKKVGSMGYDKIINPEELLVFKKEGVKTTATSLTNLDEIKDGLFEFRTVSLPRQDATGITSRRIAVIPRVRDDEDYKLFDKALEAYCQTKGYFVMRSESYSPKEKFTIENQNCLKWWTGYLTFSLYKNSKLGDTENEPRNRGILAAARENISSLKNSEGKKDPIVPTLLSLMKVSAADESIADMRKRLLNVYNVLPGGKSFNSFLTKFTSLVSASKFSPSAEIAPFLLDSNRVKAEIIKKGGKSKALAKSLTKAEKSLKTEVLEANETTMSTTHASMLLKMNSLLFSKINENTEVIRLVTAFNKSYDENKKLLKSLLTLSNSRGSLFSESLKSAYPKVKKISPKQTEEFAKMSLSVRSAKANLQVQYLQGYDPTTVLAALNITSTSTKKLALSDIKKVTENTVALEDFASNLDDTKFLVEVRGVIREFSDFATAIKNAED